MGERRLCSKLDCAHSLIRDQLMTRPTARISKSKSSFIQIYYLIAQQVICRKCSTFKSIWSLIWNRIQFIHHLCCIGLESIDLIALHNRNKIVVDRIISCSNYFNWNAFAQFEINIIRYNWIIHWYNWTWTIFLTQFHSSFLCEIAAKWILHKHANHDSSYRTHLLSNFCAL